MAPDLLYQLALTQVPGIGDVQARFLLQHYGNAETVFRARRSELESLEGIGTARAAAIRRFRDFHLAESELRYLQRAGLQAWCLTDAAYPQRLLHCYDPPTLLFGRGAADLNTPRLVAIVGTRNATDYGRSVTEALVQELAPYRATIVSGLAFGIDAIAHKAALRAGLPTIGVVGHGLARVYPYEHHGLARSMVDGGGALLSEFFHDVKPDKHNFPLRNRIVAGLCDCTVVIETQVKGGSMITARMADGYHRDVFAVPGRLTDKGSSGCHELLRQQKAQLFTSADALAEALGWKDRNRPAATQKALFVELSDDERQLMQLLEGAPQLHVDDLYLRSGLPNSSAAAALLNLELQGVIVGLPGKCYRLA
ncbi:DNA-processing protein DprA [Flaviaesturariibacter amylovorans]|uniref:DNA-processing protein DprA n=1 Tax=Flaviaesturariibacter amylovorans TaxID=1084520 RepID=A0ABP8G932_9BACT